MKQILGAKIDDANVLAMLDAILSVGGQLQPSMRQIAGLLENRVLLGFRGSVSPYGETWLPLVAREGKPLIKNRILMNSINSDYGETFAEVGTNLEYAAIHQFGGAAGRNKAAIIPARPYLPIYEGEVKLPEDWENEVLTILVKQLEKITNG
jgi:phage virion morphogenesis protein